MTKCSHGNVRAVSCLVIGTSNARGSCGAKDSETLTSWAVTAMTDSTSTAHASPLAAASRVFRRGGLLVTTLVQFSWSSPNICSMSVAAPLSCLRQDGGRTRRHSEPYLLPFDLEVQGLKDSETVSGFTLKPRVDDTPFATRAVEEREE